MKNLRSFWENSTSGSPVFWTPRLNRVVFGTLGALFFGFFFFRAWKSGHDDFSAYYNAGFRALLGESPYRNEETPFRYLPLTAYFFTPFTLFTFKTARVLFYCMNFGAITALYFQIHKRVGSLAVLLLLGLFFRFQNHDFQNAQINSVLLGLVFIWWKFRSKNLLFATLAFSLFASFKLMPLALGLPLLLLGKWKEVQWIGFWCVILNFVPVFFYDQGPLVFKDWYDQIKIIEYPASTLPHVQSLQSALWWYLKEFIEPRRFAFLSHALQLSLFIAVFLMAPRSDGSKVSNLRRENWTLLSSLALTVVISQLAWKHNYLQFLPLAVLWFIEDPKFQERRTRILYGIAILGMAIIPSSLSGMTRGGSERYYLLVATALAVIFLGLSFARKKPQIFPIEK